MRAPQVNTGVENTRNGLLLTTGPVSALTDGMMTGIEDTDTRTDLDLLALARDGRREAFGQLVGRHYRTCVKIATFMLRDRAEAEDEVQQACWKAFEHLDQYLGEAEFSTWLLRIVVNECLMLMRVRKRARFLYLDGDQRSDEGRPMELPSASPDPEQDLVKREMLEVLKREIRRIPPLLRNVILLRDVEELPMPDVAERLGITVPAAKSRLLRARIELRERVVQRFGPAKHMMPLSSEQTMPAKSTRRLAWAV